MNPAAARDLLAEVSAAWVADPASAVVWAGEHEGRWGMRMAQEARDFTTLWFDVGERTLGYEAYLLPRPPANRAEVYRQCLVRNRASWLAGFRIDHHGDLAIGGRVPLDGLDAGVLDAVVGAVYDLVEVAFRGLLRAGFPTREKTS